jgi:hypothetical protein
MKNNKGDHPQLAGLKALWNYPDDTLNKVLWASTDWSAKEESIGHASAYLDHMDAIAETDDPKEAWESWCTLNKIEHEIPNNPYIN